MALPTRYGFSIKQGNEVLHTSPFHFARKTLALTAGRRLARSMQLNPGRNRVAIFVEAEAVGADNQHFTWIYNREGDHPVQGTGFTPPWDESPVRNRMV